MVEGVGRALLHVVVEKPGDHLALVERVFLKRNEVYEDQTLRNYAASQVSRMNL